MSIFSQKHAQYAFSSTLKQQKCHKMKKKAIHKAEICKKQANFNQNKPKNKQPASLQKNLQVQLHKKTSPNSGEIRKVGNTVCKLKLFT